MKSSTSSIVIKKIIHLDKYADKLKISFRYIYIDENYAVNYTTLHMYLKIYLFTEIQL